MNKKWIRLYLFVWVFIWVLIAFQAYIMARAMWLLPLIIILPIMSYYYGMHWFHAYEKRKKWSVIINYIWIACHFLPVVLQVFSIITPTIDRIIVGGVGLFLYYVTRPHSVPVLHQHKKDRKIRNKHVRKKKTIKKTVKKK